jgi:hypothetical protein
MTIDSISTAAAAPKHAHPVDLEVVREYGRKYARQHSVISMNLASDYLLTAFSLDEYNELFAEFERGTEDEVRDGTITAEAQQHKLESFASNLPGFLG